MWGTPGYIGQALTVAGLVRGGDEGLGLLREGVAELERSPARRELAVALVELGAALRRRGERTAAREPLRLALDLADAGGLAAIAGRAREELRVSGARVRRPALSGLDSLTPSERRIADLAARGHEQPRDRAGAVRDRQDRRDAPRPRVPQARHPLAPGAGRR